MFYWMGFTTHDFGATRNQSQERDLDKLLHAEALGLAPWKKSRGVCLSCLPLDLNPLARGHGIVWKSYFSPKNRARDTKSSNIHLLPSIEPYEAAISISPVMFHMTQLNIHTNKPSCLPLRRQGAQCGRAVTWGPRAEKAGTILGTQGLKPLEFGKGRRAHRSTGWVWIWIQAWIATLAPAGQVT